jgi:hypothetical protein
MIVYRAGRFLREVSTRTGRTGRLVKTALTSLGLALSRSRLVWAENHNRVGRLRAFSVG